MMDQRQQLLPWLRTSPGQGSKTGARTHVMQHCQAVLSRPEPAADRPLGGANLAQAPLYLPVSYVQLQKTVL